MTYSWLTWLVHTRAEADSFFFLSFLVIIVFFCVCVKNVGFGPATRRHFLLYLFFFFFFIYFGCFCLVFVCVCYYWEEKPRVFVVDFLSSLHRMFAQFSRNGMEPASFSFVPFPRWKTHQGGEPTFFYIDYTRDMFLLFSTKTKRDASGNGFPLSFSTTLHILSACPRLSLLCYT